MTLVHVFGYAYLDDGELLAWYGQYCDADTSHNQLQLLLRDVPWITVKQHGESSTIVVNPKELFAQCEFTGDHVCAVCYDNDNKGGFIRPPCCNGACIHLECMLKSLSVTDTECPFCKKSYFRVQ